MAIPKFIPKEGQVDFTNIRWAPVINCVVEHNGKILIVQRNKEMRLYPECWNGISGFLDDNRGLEEKVRDELREEVGIQEGDIESIRLGTITNQEEPQYNKTWIVHPVLVKVKTDQIKLDWEAQDYKWIYPADLLNYKLLPGFAGVVKNFFD